MFKFRDTGLVDRRNHELDLVGALRPRLTRPAAEQALDVIGQRLGTTYPASAHEQAYVLGGLLAPTPSDPGRAS